MLRSRLLQTILGILVLLPGCGTSIGNPPKSNEPAGFALVGFKITNKDGADFYTKDSQGQNMARIVLEVNRLVLKDVSFFQGTKPATPTFANSHLVDLVAGTIEPSVDLTQLAATAFPNASFSLAQASKGQFPSVKDDDKLIGNSFHIKGSIEYMGIKRDFEYVIPWTQEITIEGVLPQGATNVITAGNAQTIVVGLNVSKWFEQITQDDINNTPVLLAQILKAIQETTSVEVQSN